MSDTKPFYKQNIDVARRLHPGLISLIENVNVVGAPEREMAGKTEEDTRYRIIPSKKGEPTIVATSANGNEIYLHSRYDPVIEADKIINSMEPLGRENFIIVIGAGLCYLPMALAKALRLKQTLIVVESSIAIFRLALETVDLTQLLERDRTFFTVGDTVIDMVREIIPQDTDGLWKTAYYVNPACSVLQAEETERVVTYLDAFSTPGMKSALKYNKCAAPVIKALLLEGGFFIERELAATFERMGNVVRRLPAPLKGEGDELFVQNLLETILDFKPDFIVSINQIGFDLAGSLADMLDYYGILTVYWFVDNPLPIIHWSPANQTPSTVALIWDREYVAPMKELGYTNVHYFPYGTDDSIFHPIAGRKTTTFPISFVGSSMTEIIDRRVEEFRNNKRLIKKFWEYAKWVQQPGSHLPPDEIVDEEREKGAPEAEIASFDSALASAWTRNKRRAALEAIAHLKPHLFGDAGWKIFCPKGVELHASVDYRRELPEIYRRSAVNLDVPNVQLRFSLNQRVFDVTACGVALLTESCGALSNFFEPDLEVATYGSLPELVEKAEYLLNYPEERERIASAGAKRTLTHHTYMQRVKKLVGLMRDFADAPRRRV